MSFIPVDTSIKRDLRTFVGLLQKQYPVTGNAVGKRQSELLEFAVVLEKERGLTLEDVINTYEAAPLLLLKRFPNEEALFNKFTDVDERTLSFARQSNPQFNPNVLQKWPRFKKRFISREDITSIREPRRSFRDRLFGKRRDETKEQKRNRKEAEAREKSDRRLFMKTIE